jgi:hypothetical protein
MRNASAAARAAQAGLQRLCQVHLDWKQQDTLNNKVIER